MIILNGSYPFDNLGIPQVSRLTRARTLEDSITGYLISFQSRWSRWAYNYTLVCGKDDKDNLEELFANTLGPFDFVDHRGFSWLTESGTDDDTHAYSTGAYFAAGFDIEERAELVGGYYACGQFWNIPVTIIPNARALNGDSASSPILPGGSEGLMQAPIVPGGTINGINATFTTPVAYSFILLFKNGQEMKVAVDYNYSGSTITFIAGAIPQTGDSLDCYGVL